MDIFHTGKEDANDDHKFVNERLLELAIPDEPSDGRAVTLEECLEMFFNNKIEVKRYLDQLERRNTMNSIQSRPSSESTKAQSSHIEIAEIKDISQPSSPSAVQSPSNATPVLPSRPVAPRRRAPSIIQEHYIDEKRVPLDHSPIVEGKGPATGRVRKEVMMPAWQFFSLIPWYTHNVPSNDAQVAAHFSSTRPILGICLKRYSMLPNGTAVKRKSHIDIPLEIGLPHFIQDDKMAEDGPAFGNFKLSLQSVVCHQGMSTESGHYISLVRSPDLNQPGEDRWLRFDDLAKERVTYTDVGNFLVHESPYLLFYQVIPIEGDPSRIAGDDPSIMNGDKPPAYSESDASRDSKLDSGFSGLSTSPRFSYNSSEEPKYQSQRPSVEIHRSSTDRFVLEEGQRGRSSESSTRSQSVVFPDTRTNQVGSVRNDFLSAPGIDPNPADYDPTALTTSRVGLSRAHQKSKRRSSSRSDEKRMSTSLSRLASRMSKDRLNKATGLASDAASSKDSINGSAPLPLEQTKDTAATVTSDEKALTASEKSSDWGKLAKDVRDKSKVTHRDHQHLTKAKRKDGKPDRECLVM